MHLLSKPFRRHSSPGCVTLSNFYVIFFFFSIEIHNRMTYNNVNIT